VQDRLNSYGPATYAFTANGELTSKTLGGPVTSYTYDALGNLLHVGLPAALPDGVQTIDYIVDGQNRRVGKMVNGTLSQGWLYQDQLRPVAQLDGANNVVARFVYGSKPNVPDYMVTSGGTYRILSDHLGSPRAVVDANSRSVIETINFDEFGNETDTLATALPTGYVRIPFGFAGGLYDPDTGLVRFGTRDYDASVGRWTSKDPIRFGGGRNLYGYVVNDPIDRFDPFGQGPSEVLTCVLACSAAASPTYEACFLLVEAPPAFAACLAAIDIGYYICVATCHSSDICNGGIF
jgi:RHS repeat-associated protein